MSQAWPGLSISTTAMRGVAVFVDGENIAQSAADDILRRAEALGPLVTLRVFCDRKNPNGWDVDARFKVVYVDSIAGKNSVDIRLVIEALDIAHGGAADGFVLATTDRDFAPLAQRLRDPGFRVLGMGLAETSDRFRLACSEFHVIGAPARSTSSTPDAKPKLLPPLARIDAAVHAVIKAHGTKSNEMTLGPLANLLKSGYNLTRKDSDFATWHKYLASKPHLYALTCENGSVVVCLRQA